jgi:hypothetical protein
MRIETLLRRLLPGLAIAALTAALALMPTAASAEEGAGGAPPVTTVPAPSTEAPAPAEAQPAPAPTEAAPETPPAEVQGQSSQGSSPGAPNGGQNKSGAGGGGGAETETEAAGGVRAKQKAVSPGSLTPSLPAGLGGSIAGVPGFFIESFQVPPFLLPIFQAAGAAYGIPWQVLAAINEVETDYGRDLSVSSAGAEGWMQFLPSSWAQYGVDANGDGFRDPYNPADAIFAAARYLHAAGGATDIRAAVFSYNHSQAYVSSVMLRAQLLGGTPSELLGAVTGLTEAHFPVHAAARFSDGFPTEPDGPGKTKTLIGTSIYAQAGAPVIAVQDGQIVQIGDTPALGHFISLRDAYGNTYVYAELGDVSSVYPVLEPRVHSAPSPQVTPAGQTEAAPAGPATAGVQARSPLSEAGTVSGLALGAAAGLEAAPAAPAARQPPAVTPPQPSTPQQVAPHVTAFREGANQVYLHPLATGAQVLAGTVLGHVGGAGESHVVFQIRPAGLGAPLIDPKPILDGWVALENSSVFHAQGENPFLATSPTVGQVLLESKQQLEPQVLKDAGVTLGSCGRQDVQEGRVDKRVLAMLEYLSVSGLRPTIGGLACEPKAPLAQASNVAAVSASAAVTITAINGVPVAGHQGPGTIADTAVRRLLMLQGLSRPRRIVSLMSYPGAPGAKTNAKAANAISVVFASPHGSIARVAGLYSSALAPEQWTRLIARLGEIPDPSVSRKPSAAALPVTPSGKEAGGNH